MGIAIGNGRLYVTEAQGERLQVLGIGGEPLQIVHFGAPPPSERAGPASRRRDHDTSSPR